MKIVGISLVKNEDLYIGQVIRNIIDFCDEILIVDNHSTDDTWSIINSLCATHDKIQITRWENPMDSGQLLYPYIGKDFWAFGVDGDEVYDPAGLTRLKVKILNGKYSECFSLKGNCFHCSYLDHEKETAVGWDCPPARTITKLYNFSIIESFPQNERFHGGPAIPKPGFSTTPLNLSDTTEWEAADLRCLHAAFVPRSSLDGDFSARIPPNGNLGFKLEKYRRGPLVQKSISGFFNEDLHKSSA